MIGQRVSVIRVFKLYHQIVFVQNRLVQNTLLFVYTIVRAALADADALVQELRVLPTDLAISYFSQVFLAELPIHALVNIIPWVVAKPPLFGLAHDSRETNALKPISTPVMIDTHHFVWESKYVILTRVYIVLSAHRIEAASPAVVRWQEAALTVSVCISVPLSQTSVEVDI